MNRLGHEVSLVELAPVQALKQTLVTATVDVWAFGFDHIPGDFLGFHHGLDARLLAVVFHLGDLAARGFFIGIEIGFFLRHAAGTAKVDHGNSLLRQGRQS